jgi:VWFA-related protein
MTQAFMVPPPQLENKMVKVAIPTRKRHPDGQFCTFGLSSRVMLHRLGEHLGNHMRGTCAGLLAILALLGLARAQNESFSSRANLVPVPTLVLGADGNAVFGLRAEDFVIEDDGAERKVNLDEAADAEPVSLIIAVQCGRRAKQEFGRMAGLASMLDPVLSNPDNEAALLFFDSKLDLVQDFTNNADLIEVDLKKIEAGDDGAAILDAIGYSARLLAKRAEGRQRVLLLISETRDHGSKFTKLDDAVALVNLNDVSVYALPFSPYVSRQLDAMRGTNKDEWGANIDLRQKLADIHQAMRENIPKTLAVLTGGEYESFATRNRFEDNLTLFANHLHARYGLSFEPKDPHPGLHHIHVRLRIPIEHGLVLYRSTYWVAKTAN